MGYAKPDDDSARKIANAIGLDHAFVLAIIHGDRAETEETRATWRRIAKQFGKAAAVAIIASGASVAPSPAEASHGQSVAGSVYYVKRRRPWTLPVAERAAFA